MIPNIGLFVTLCTNLFYLRVHGEYGYIGYSALDKALEGLSADYGNAGCTVSAYKFGEMAYNYGTGEIDIDADTHIMRVASLSKMVAATAMLIAIDEDIQDMNVSIYSTIADVLEFDAEKAAIFNKFSLKSYYKTITIKQLLSMNSGIRHYGALNEYLWHPDASSSASILEQYLSLFADDALVCEPGTCYLYSSFGFYIVAELIEIITGEDFYEYEQAKIFDVLGLEDIGDYLTLERELFAKQYQRICNQVDSEYKFLADCFLNDTYSSIKFDEIVYYKKAAGNVISTSLDFVKYVDSLFWNRDGLLSDELHSQMFKGQTYNRGTSPTDDWYGFGWHMYGENDANIYWHTGGAVGGITIVRVIKDLELVSAVFCDIQSTGDGTRAMIAKVEEFFGADFEFPTTTETIVTEMATTEEGGNPGMMVVVGKWYVVGVMVMIGWVMA